MLSFSFTILLLRLCHYSSYTPFSFYLLSLSNHYSHSSPIEIYKFSWKMDGTSQDKQPSPSTTPSSEPPSLPPSTPADPTSSQQTVPSTSSSEPASSSPYPAPPPPTREVYCQDALAWLEAQTFIPGSVVTSLPDVSEVPMSVPEWKAWFSKIVTLILHKLLPQECAIFYQTDVKYIKQGKYPNILWHSGSFV